MAAGMVRTIRDVDPVRRPADTAAVYPLLTDPHYAEPLCHRMIHFGRGQSLRRQEPAHDELIFVMGGHGVLHVGSEEHQIGEGSAALLTAGEQWSVTMDDADELKLSSVLVPAPPGPLARSLVKPSGPLRRIARQGSQGVEQASSSREYEALFDAAHGSSGATQFIGFIPPSGAPAHYHLYDEICVIVRGTGALHALGQQQPLSAGSTFHITPRLLHSVENTGDDDLWILGVFRPEGSPSAAYYPDGRPAPGHDDTP
jgi:quercetin dioxygenase-like cupin family protein